MELYFKPKILLASQSPRRKQILSDSGFDLEIIKMDVEESFPQHLQAAGIAEYLADKKNLAYLQPISDNTLLVTSDTIVWMDNTVLNKPKDLEDARKMLKNLSGAKHTVYTGVAVRSNKTKIVFSECTDVYFNTLDDKAIAYYLSNYSPLDKAGAYGIQEFIGYIGIKRIEGCYYNVMGFPVSRFVSEIKHLL